MIRLPMSARSLRLAMGITVALLAGPTAAEQDTPTPAAERCRSNPPGLHTADMIASGFAVLYRNGGDDKEFVRLQYVYGDQLYYRYEGRNWRAMYLAHPSAVYEGKAGEPDAICAYISGFPIDSTAGGTATWVPFGDVNFVETP